MASFPSLHDVLSAGPLEPRDAATFMASLGRALDALHDSGTAHLALSPATVFVGPAPERPVELAHGGPKDLAWLAPEQLDDPEGAIVAADVFTAALLAFYALTGRAMFVAAEAAPPDPQALRDEIGSRPSAHARARALGVEIPAKVEDVFRRALAPLASERHATAGELAMELAALADSQRTFAAAPPTSRDPAGPFFDDPLPDDAAPLLDLPPMRELELPSQPPHLTPGLISLVTKAAPAAYEDARLPSMPDEAPASVSRVPLARLPFDPDQFRPPPQPLLQQIPKRTLAILAGGAALFVVVTGVVLYLAFRRRPEPPVDAGDAGTASAETASVSVAALETPPSPSPSESPTPSASDDAPAAPAFPPFPATKLRPGEGELLVTCEPECENVAIDGKLTKRTGPMAIRSGAHAIGVSKTGYVGQWRKVPVPAATRTTVVFNLAEAPPAPPPKKPRGR